MAPMVPTMKYWKSMFELGVPPVYLLKSGILLPLVSPLKGLL